MIKKTGLYIAIFYCFTELFSPSGQLFAEDPGVNDESFYWDHPTAIKVKDDEMAYTGKIFQNLRNQNTFFMSRFNNGWVFMTSFFGFRTKNGFIKRWGIFVVVADPEGHSFFVTHEIKPADIEFADDHLFITDGTNFIEGRGMIYRIKYDFPGFSCDIRYDNILPPWKPGDGYEQYTEDNEVFERRIVTCPWGDVTGTLEFEGKNLSIRGEGYGEFSLITTPFNRMDPYMHVLRLFSPNGTSREERWHLGILDYTNHEAYGAKRFPRLILARGGQYVITTKDYQLTGQEWLQAPDTPWEYPRNLKILYNKDGYYLEGTYTSRILFSITDIFKEIPVLIRNFLMLFMSRPVYIRTMGDFTGILITPDGKEYSLHLYGPYEYLLTK